MKYYCKEPNCNNEIYYETWKYGSGKCRSCAHIGTNHKDINNPNFGNEWTETQKKRQSVLTKKAMAKINMKEILLKRRNYNGKNNPMFGKPSPNTIRETYKGIWMRSSWETLFAKYLDRIQTQWSYEPKRFNLGQLTYTPDFYLPEFDCYIEIKGWWRDDAKEKFDLFKKLYPKIKINLLMENDLIKLGVLK